jgi:hypothetical protein
MTYACPEAKRLPLEAEDPLRAAALFVQRGKQLEAWATDPILPATQTGGKLAAPLDSLRAAIGMIARSFHPAVATAASHERECSGPSALPCTRAVRARDVVSRIDAAMMREALDDYFRYRSTLAEAFAREGAPLRKLTMCREDA